MAKTTWGPAPWLPKQTWLLHDNSVVQTPDLETTTSGQRVRVAGTTKSFGKTQVDAALEVAVKEIAAQRLTTPWVRLNDDDTNRAGHGNASPGAGTTPDFSQPATLHWSDPNLLDDQYANTQIVFEYVSEECPGVTAMVWIILSKSGYSAGRDYHIQSGITYQFLHSSQPAPLYMRFSGESRDWSTPYNRYDHSDEVERSNRFLQEFEPIPDFQLKNTSHRSSPRPAVIDALTMIKTLVDTEYLSIPVWRTDQVVSAARFKFKRSNFNNALYQEMVAFVQTKATVDRIRENYQQIVRDMSSLGIVMGNKSRNDFLEVVEQAFAEDVQCHMIPLTEDGNPRLDEDGSPQIVEDHAHSVSVDFLTGTIVVNCSQHDTEVIEHWNFERTKAELHGELDAFLGFARQKQAKRVRKTFNRIVKERTPDEVDIDLSVNA